MPYLIDGKQVKVVKEYEDGYLVCNIYETSGDRKPGFGEPYFMHKTEVFNSVPHQVYDEDISKKKELIEKLQGEKYRVEHEIAEMHRKRRKLEGIAKEDATFEHILDIVSGAITHVVVVGGFQNKLYPKEIQEFDSNSIGHDSVVLRLYYKYGEFGWEKRRIKGRYDDTVLLATSLKEAHEKAQALFDEYSENNLLSLRVIGYAQKLNLNIAKEKITEAKEREIKRAQKTVNEKQKNLDRALRELEQVKE